MIKALLLPTRPEALRGMVQNLQQVVSPHSLKIKPKMEPDIFLKTWISKLYGVNPGEPLYKKACITELLRQTSDIVSYGTIERVWNWEDGKSDFPKYLPVILAKAHKEYQMQEVLGCLPSFSIFRDTSTEN